MVSFGTSGCLLLFLVYLCVIGPVALQECLMEAKVSRQCELGHQEWYYAEAVISHLCVVSH